MSYLALYRKYRPLVFDDLVGQKQVTDAMKNEIYKKNVAHAYIFFGIRGTGKTTTARIFSRAINCLDNKDGNPCNLCPNCQGILNGSILDVMEIDAASNTGVDNIRELRENLNFGATTLAYRVYIIDEVHMLSKSAFNAFLKVLEEPPPHVKFVLATTEASKVPATVLSRCQRFDFRRIKKEYISQMLKNVCQKEGFDFEDKAIDLISRLADGSMRDGLSLLEQSSFLKSPVTYAACAELLGVTQFSAVYALFYAIANKSEIKAVEVINRYSGNYQVYLETFIKMCMDLLLCKVGGNGLSEYDQDESRLMSHLDNSFSKEMLIYMLEVANDAMTRIKYSPGAVFVVELAAIKMCNPMLSDQKEALAMRISNLENSPVIPQTQIVEQKQESPTPIKKKYVPPGKKVEAIVGCWQYVLNQLQKNNHTGLYMALFESELLDEGDKLVLTFSDEFYNPAMNMIGDKLHVIADIIEEKLGFVPEIILKKQSQTDGNKPINSDPLEGLAEF